MEFKSGCKTDDWSEDWSIDFPIETEWCDSKEEAWKELLQKVESEGIEPSDLGEIPDIYRGDIEMKDWKNGRVVLNKVTRKQGRLTVYIEWKE